MKKVMVVDDAGFIRLLLTNMLTAEGFDVVAGAKTGVEAVQYYKRYMPDVVTMDITMPDMDGIEALCKIMEFDRKAKVVMCSAMGQQKLVVQSIQNGAKDFIVKPFQKERVIDTLNKVLCLS